MLYVFVYVRFLIGERHVFVPRSRLFYALATCCTDYNHFFFINMTMFC